MPQQPDLNRLLSILNTSGIQNENSALYQVIKQLINAIKQLQGIIVANVDSTNLDITALAERDEPFLSHDVPSNLTNYRRLLAGLNITFDDTVANERTINGASAGSQWDVLTDGDLIETELIFADGEVIMLETV